MAENRDTSDSTNSSIKLDQVRNVPGGALLRTMAGAQGRFMVASPVQSTALISTTTTIQTQQVLPKVTGQVGVAGVNRISSVPIQAPTTTGYHVPRGAAAVANISAPRSSVATPIVRGPTTLQTISVGQQHSLSTSSPNVGRPVVGVTCLSGQTRPAPIPAGARLVSSQIRPIGDVSGSSCRPVLVHKQVTLTQQQVQMSGTVKSYSNTTRHPGAPSLSRFTALSPGMVQITPAATTAVFLPSQPIKPQPPPKVISQAPPHATVAQIPSATSSVPQTLSISTVVSRPVVLGGSGSVENSIRPAIKPNTATTPTDTNKLYIPGPRSTILIRDPPRTKESEPINITSNSTQPTTTTTTGVNTLYTLPNTAYFDGGSVRPLVTLAPASKITQATPTIASQPMRINPVMVVDQPQQPPRIHALVPPPPNTENSHSPLAACDSSCLPANTVGCPVPLTKQVTSPRPSILRKRDPDGIITSSISLPKKPRSPMKVSSASKNLTPLMGNISGSGSPPTLPPSPPPKRPESSSGGSTTVSANSSPGESPSEPPPSIKEEEEPPPLRSLPPEVSPRKKPRKQQLTGNQITEPTFSEDDMEFITEEKLKKELKEETETKVIPKKKTMSLLSSYKNHWKPRNNHFMRYTDVRAKEEKVPNMSDVANQKYALQKIDGWKVYHLRSQLDDMVTYEEEFTDFYNSLLCVLEINQQKNSNKDIDKEYSRVNEIVKANFQRTKVAKDQMVDAKTQMMRFFDHKPYISDLINKNISKRSGNKKRDRTQ